MVKNRVKVSICDVNYSLVADNEEQSHVFEAAANVDVAMKTILKEAHNLVENEKVAVLAALQFSSSCLKLEHDKNYCFKKISELTEKIEQELAFLNSF